MIPRFYCLYCLNNWVDGDVIKYAEVSTWERDVSFEYIEFKMSVQVEWEIEYMRSDFLERERMRTGVEISIWNSMVYRC